MNQEFRLINYFLEEIRQNELMSRKHKKVCTNLTYIENILILASTITGCISVSAFASFNSIPLGNTSSAITRITSWFNWKYIITLKKWIKNLD